MRTRSTVMTVGLLTVAALAGEHAGRGPFPAAMAQEKAGSVPPLVEQINNGNWLDEAEA